VLEVSELIEEVIKEAPPVLEFIIVLYPRDSTTEIDFSGMGGMYKPGQRFRRHSFR
jgi:hypothetical protein